MGILKSWLILRVLPFETVKKSTHLYQEFANSHYVPVAKSYIDQVYISINDDTRDGTALIHMEIDQTFLSTEACPSSTVMV